MSRWRPDQIDLWCEEWARERRKVHGLRLNERLLPFERIGRLSCTLGRVKEEAEGASHSSVRIGENGQVDRHWPEVYRGEALEIHRGFLKMREEWRVVMDIHYVLRYTPNKQKSAFLGISDNEYLKRLAHLKIFLGGHLGLDVHRPPKTQREIATSSAQYSPRNGLIPSR